MGYRSEVKCVIYGRPEFLDAFIAKHAIQNNSFLSELKEYITYGLTDRLTFHPDGTSDKIKCKVMDFDGSSLKWYDEYDEVQGLTDMLDDIDENWDKKLDFEFIRVGEEAKDIETKYSRNAYGFLSTSTSITNDMALEDLPNETD